MHPPLDRPHPECQNEIEKLRDCQDNRSFFNILACNDFKAAMDKCFKAEKAKLLKSMNKDMHEKRKEEEEAWADAVGHKVSFDEYLKQDKGYQAELEKQKSRSGGIYQEKSMGGSLS